MDKCLKLFVKHLKEAINDNGKGVEEIAKSAGIVRGTIYNYMKGERVPPLDVAASIAKALGIPLSKMIGESATEHSPHDCYLAIGVALEEKQPPPSVSPLEALKVLKTALKSFDGKKPLSLVADLEELLSDPKKKSSQ